MIDASFIKELPSTVDACGENGEFHTLVLDCPLFTGPIEVTTGRKIQHA
jgi:diphthamide synthase (EF-2-diphthine--ammonia ligase)